MRRAAIAITDRFAIRAIAGGPYIGPIAQSYIPPGFPGSKESGGVNGFSDFDWMQHPDGGSAEVAKKYMLLAKKDGEPIDADGKYTGGGDITAVVGRRAGLRPCRREACSPISPRSA